MNVSNDILGMRLVSCRPTVASCQKINNNYTLLDNDEPTGFTIPVEGLNAPNLFDKELGLHNMSSASRSTLGCMMDTPMIVASISSYTCPDLAAHGTAGNKLELTA